MIGFEDSFSDRNNGQLRNSLLHIHLFQKMLDQSIKLEDKTARLCGIFFLDKFMKNSYASPIQ